MTSPNWLGEWWTWIVAGSLQASPLLILAWIADRAFVRRAWPQILKLIWLAGLLRFFLPPGLGSPWSLTSALGDPSLTAAQRVPGTATPTLAFLVWLAGALFALTARGYERSRLQASIELSALPRQWSDLLANAAQTLSLVSIPRVGSMAGLQTAAVFGLAQPTLLLPRAWLARQPTQRDEHALLHELAHLKARDLWFDELVALARALVWFHPLAWIAARRLHDLSELQCDLTVARALGRGSSAYRETLILATQALLRPVLGLPTPRGLRAFVGRQNSVVVRIERLERLHLPPIALVRGASASLLLVLAACILPMAPHSHEWREQARRVFAAEKQGTYQSCFTLQAAAILLADESP